MYYWTKLSIEFLLKDKNLSRRVDLICIDPAFATNSNFTITNGRSSTISNSKNGDILDLIIKNLSNKNSIVIDYFCGSGRYLKSAHLLNRHWIGIDKLKLAIKITTEKIKNIKENLFALKAEYELIDSGNGKVTNETRQRTVNTTTEFIRSRRCCG